MKVVVLHGQNHKGSTYHITQLFLEELADENTEVEVFYFTHNTPCTGCYSCFIRGEETCPHYEENRHIMKALEEADLIVLESPNYCMGMTGQLKVFLDHMAYRWISHRPHGTMFSKVGLCISTTAGMGAKKVTKDLARQLFYWGVSSVFRYSKNIRAINWGNVSLEEKVKIKAQVKKHAIKIKYRMGYTSPGIKLKIIFMMMRLSHKNNKWNETDKKYWEQQGWLQDNRPW